MSDSTQSPADVTVSQLTALAGAALGDHSLIEYRGTQTAMAFSSTQDELAAMLGDAGVCDLGWRAFLRCAGRDRVRWLNGMVTNSVKDLGETAGCYAFVLNAQGRIQGDLNIYRRSGDPDALWLETDRAQIDPLLAFVRRYIIMDQVTLEPQEQWTAIGIAGPNAEKKLKAVGVAAAEMSPMHIGETAWQGHAVAIVAAYSPLVPRYELWIESTAAPDLWKALTHAGAIPCGASAVEQLRILEGTPAYGVDIGNRDLPQETNQMRALNFNKGCYLGQEIVERIRSRGNVHRTSSGFVLASDLPEGKTEVLAGEKAVGEITSAARIAIPGHGERVLALGSIRREALESGTPLSAEGISVKPHVLPFDFTRTVVQP